MPTNSFIFNVKELMTCKANKIESKLVPMFNCRYVDCVEESTHWDQVTSFRNQILANFNCRSHHPLPCLTKILLYFSFFLFLSRDIRKRTIFVLNEKIYYEVHQWDVIFSKSLGCEYRMECLDFWWAFYASTYLVG